MIPPEAGLRRGADGGIDLGAPARPLAAQHREGQDLPRAAHVGGAAGLGVHIGELHNPHLVIALVLGVRVVRPLHIGQLHREIVQDLPVQKGLDLLQVAGGQLLGVQLVPLVLRVDADGHNPQAQPPIVSVQHMERRLDGGVVPAGEPVHLQTGGIGQLPLYPVPEGVPLPPQLQHLPAVDRPPVRQRAALLAVEHGVLESVPPVPALPDPGVHGEVQKVVIVPVHAGPSSSIM